MKRGAKLEEKKGGGYFRNNVLATKTAVNLL